MMKLSISTICLALFLLPLSLTAQFCTGMNLAEVSPWDAGIYYADAFKENTGWAATSFDGSEFGMDSVGNVLVTIPQLPNGYPTQVPFVVNGDSLRVAALFLSGMPAPQFYPSGNYTLTIEGSGEIELGGDANGTFTGPGTYTVNPTPSDEGFILRILESNPQDPITGVHFYLPNHGPNDLWNSRFLNLIQDWGVVRFMKPTATEENNIIEWNDRTTEEYYTYFTDSEEPIVRPGMPWEYVIRLANQENFHPWITIPYAANDDYVVQLARMFRDSLNPNLRVYLEYSNETWNTIYQGTYDYVTTQGLQAGYAPDPFSAGQLFTVARSLEMFKIWEQEFGGSASSRIVKVLAGQMGRYNADLIAQGLNSPIINPDNVSADALSLAPYFGTEVYSRLDTNLYCSYTQADILDSLMVEFDLVMNDPNEGMVPWREYADSLGLMLTTYESGQHLVTGFFDEPDSCVVAQFAGLNRSQAMGALYQRYAEYLRDTFEVDVEVGFVLWASEYYREYFGLLENMYQNEATAVKWNAYQQYWLPSSNCQLPNGVEEMENALALTIYPNPNSGDWLHVAPAERALHVQAFDLTGRKVLDTEVEDGRIPIRQLPGNQVYLIRVIGPKGVSATLRMLRQ